MAPAIPERWLNYNPVGKRIVGTRFIAFKVPLREHIVKAVDLDSRLDVVSLFRHIPNLGLIIDLTNTHRFYDPEVIRQAGVEYKKLMIPGHNTPADYLAIKFKLYVMDFLNLNKDNDKLIGVHCTHGVNRTGYLICNYMISELNFSAQEAISSFEEARGHNIERQNYIEHLYKLSYSSGKTFTKLSSESSRTSETYEGQTRTRADNWRSCNDHDNKNDVQKYNPSSSWSRYYRNKGINKVDESNVRTVDNNWRFSNDNHDRSQRKYNWRSSNDYHDRNQRHQDYQSSLSSRSRYNQNLKIIKVDDNTNRSEVVNNWRSYNHHDDDHINEATKFGQLTCPYNRPVHNESHNHPRNRYGHNQRRHNDNRRQ